MSKNCECRQTTKELAQAVSVLAGFRVTTERVLTWRARLAQEYCDEMFEKDPDQACAGNPYLASEMIGLSYIYSKRRARQLAKAIAARVCANRTAGRRKQMRRDKTCV